MCGDVCGKGSVRDVEKHAKCVEMSVDEIAKKCGDGCGKIVWNVCKCVELRVERVWRK